MTATLILVAIGGFTRGGGSGYGCQDRWPLCEDGLLGGLLPRAEYHMIVEWTHRWVASIVGVLAVATAVTAWRQHRDEPTVVRPAVAAVLTIGVQAWVGRMVVKGDLDADLVSIHLAISMAVLALLAMVLVATNPEEMSAQGRDPAWTRLLAGAAVLSVGLLLLGSYVHNLYVSGWPLVGDSLSPDLSNRYVAVHYVHRLVAGVGLVYLIYLTVEVRRRDRPETEGLIVRTACTAYAVNVGLGAAHVFTEVSSSLLVAGHLAMAALVWVSLVAATGISRSEPRSAEDANTAPLLDRTARS